MTAIFNTLIQLLTKNQALPAATNKIAQLQTQSLPLRLEAGTMTEIAMM